DPALGVYAALAYSQAGLDDQVESLLYPMQADLGTSIFDVVLLASRRVDPQEWPMVPFCPVLTQNWSAVRPRQFELNPILEPLQSHLLNSLWTTFGPGVGDTLLVAVENGELQ
ncbi:MAG: hypothetical protein OER95_02225, partial [Acidimicrobiia bacterium]|nr:hypothetical protein [Acidimicrobiia bacterium]